MKLRMTFGVPGHLKQRLEDVDQDVVEGSQQLGALEHITETQSISLQQGTCY